MIKLFTKYVLFLLVFISVAKANIQPLTSSYDLRSSEYGVRYYDPRTSVWQSPDPILDQYMNGKVNGGVFNPKNLQLFTYTYNNPVNMVDPDGKLTIVIHGTYAKDEQWPTKDSSFNRAVSKTFSEQAVAVGWTGGNNHEARVDGAKKLAGFIKQNLKENEKLNIVAHSHGGNVVKEYTKMQESKKIDTFVALGTPQRKDHEMNLDKVDNYYNVSSSFDMIQPRGGGKYSIMGQEFGPAGQTDQKANNIQILPSIRNIKSPYSDRLIRAYGHSDLHDTKVWNEQIAPNIK